MRFFAIDFLDPGLQELWGFTQPWDPPWQIGKSADVTGFLDGFQGLLQTDAYAPYLNFAKNNE